MGGEARSVIKRFIIPKCRGKAFVVKQGHLVRVIQVGGGQISSIRFINAHNYREQFSVVSSILNNIKDGERKAYYRIKKLYSNVPWERVMCTVVTDTSGVHTMGSNCSSRSAGIMEKPGHRSCEDNFHDCLRDFGIAVERLIPRGAFNAFMPRIIDEDGNVNWAFSPSKDGDYIEFLAEVDLLVAVSNCLAH